MEIFADKLKKLRAEKELSQAELAEKIFVSRSAVAKWEQGRGFPNIDSLQLISKEFCVTVDELISEKEVEILKVQKDKKLSVRTKLLIAVSVILALIIAIGSTIAIMFYPRSLSKYLDFNENDIAAIYLEYYKYSEENGSETLIVNLEDSKKDFFIDYVKKIEIIPRYLAIKKSMQYKFCIDCGNKTYKIDSLGVRLYENGESIKFHKFRLYSGTDKNLLILFDMDMNDLR